MRHYILTRASYGPYTPPGANQRRLALLRGVTARSLRSQTNVDWTWIGLLDVRDPLFEERAAIFDQVATWNPSEIELHFAPWGKDPHGTTELRGQVAATAYEFPWPVDHAGKTLQTRLDDDDAFAPDALARIRKAAGSVKGRGVIVLPVGVRVDRGRYSAMRHETNMFQTLVTPRGDTLSVYDYGHRFPPAPVRLIDDEVGWIWLRNRDTLSTARSCSRRIDAAFRAAWPIDWTVVP